jgi:putative transposase
LQAAKVLVTQYMRLVSPDHAYYRWRREYGGLDLDQAKRLKKLEKENARLKRTIADLALDKQILKQAAEGNF